MRFLQFLLFLSLITILSAAAASGQSREIKAVQEYRNTHEHEILTEYMEFLRLPNVNTDIENIHKNVRYLVSEFEKRGVNMEVLTLPGKPEVPPVVYGELTTPGAERTLIIYVHYDGQPADPANWVHAPWEPKLYSAGMHEGGVLIDFPKKGEPINPDWRIYARSASDDKVPFPAILATLDGLQQAGIPLTSNIKFFFEGEEEAGSPHLREYLECYKDKLDSDLWLFFDGPMHQSGKPQIVFGVRGDMSMDITVYGPARPLHSGHYGGWAPVPGQMLANLLASMRSETGEILIDGFNDNTAPITEADRKAFATLPDYDEEIRAGLGLKKTEFNNRPLIESLMYPTLTIRGMSSGNVGSLARNVIPTKAEASLDIRLAKGNGTTELLDKIEAHIRKQGYHIVREEPGRETLLQHEKTAKVTRFEGYPAVRTSTENKLAQNIAAAVHHAAGEEVILYPTMGGSLPLFHFTDILGTPVIIVPIANFDNNQHAENENIRIGNIWYGVDVYAGIFTMK